MLHGIEQTLQSLPHTEGLHILDEQVQVRCQLHQDIQV